MYRKKRIQDILYLVLLLLILFPIISSALQDEQKAYEMIHEYFDLIRSGNYESAMTMWEPSALSRSARLGIEYNNIAVKPDCNSPVLNNYDQVKNQLSFAIKSKSTLDTGLIRLQFNVETEEGSVNYLYYSKKLGDYFWLIFAQDYYAADWLVYESKYFKFYVNPERDDSYNEIAATSLDSFVDKMAAKISIAPDRMEILANEKINYYLCENEYEVGRLSGKQTDGIYDQASDAVISSVFPEFHLVARLLVNFKLQTLPLFSLPVFEEGLAISLGGRWHRSPGVILNFGEYILDYKLTEIDSVLTAIGNENNEISDITFPIEACLVDYIYNSLGTEKFFQLYRKLSGDLAFINSLTIDEVKTIMARSFDLPWPEFKKQFEGFIAGDNSFKGMILPGQINTDQELLNDGGLVVSSSDKWLKISFCDKDSQNPELNLLFSKPQALNEKTSELFYEQYKAEQEYNGYRFGIRIDMNEIGLYDYAVNQLKAKYVYNFAPDPAYFDSANGKITAYFDIKLLENILPGASDYQIIK